MKETEENTESFGKLNRRRFLQTSVAAAGVTTLLSGSKKSVQAAPPVSVNAEDVKQFVPAGSGKPVYISDLGNSFPSTAMSRKWRKEKWKVLDFETEDTKGTMLVSGQNTTPPEVTYKFKQKGWHAIYIALYSYRYYSRAQVKLKSDPVFSIITQRDEVWRRQYEEGRGIFYPVKIDEHFWKYADVTNEEISFKTLSIQTVPENEDSVGNINNAVWIPYVKLVPLSDEEVEEIKKEREEKNTRRLIATHDVFTPHCWMRWTGREDIEREIEPFKNTDFFRMEWEAGMGDVTYYPSKIGRYFTLDWQENHYSQIHRHYVESHKLLKEKNIDPFRVAVETAHKAGLEFYAAYRPSGFLFPPPEDEWNAGGFFDKNPQLRTRDQEGREVPRLSYVYPEVRKFVVSILDEVAANYPIDGVTLAYCRRPPFLMYEKPAVDAFIKEYGSDPRKLPEEDARWLKFKSRYMTMFMRELRTALNERAKKQGRKKPIGISAAVPGTERENKYFGLDLKTWADEGLVDNLVGWGGLHFDRMTFLKPGEADYLVNCTKNSKCTLALNMMPRVMTPDEYMERADLFYKAGADYLYFWDTYQRGDYSPAWTALRRLGHKEEIAAWAKGGAPKRKEPPKIKFLKSGNWDYRYASPG
ncbi:MAG: family 10 glycosylhydrolase [Pyrinomonadaceae bacterium]